MRKRRMFFIVSLILFFSSIAALISMYCSIDKHTAKTTTEYEGTLSTVKITDIGNKKYIELFVEEYDYSLYISESVCQQIDDAKIANLQKGSKLFFSIENRMKKYLKEVDFVNIVSLKTNDHIIFSISDYNSFMNTVAKPTKTVGIIVSIVLLLFTIYFGFQITTKSLN